MSKTLGNRGFTLIELLVAMVLVAMVTLIVGVALKLAIGAWERGVEEGEDTQLRAVIPSLLEKQIRCLVQNDPFAAGGTRVLPFCGQEHALSFFTSYAPQGSPAQGLLRVTYVFDEDKETLSVYEQVITRQEDLKDENSPLSDRWNKSMEPISQAQHVTAFDLAYNAEKKMDPEDERQWKKKWDCRSTSLPSGVRLGFQVGKKRKEESPSWYLRAGAAG